jgi:hypothetical protein
MWRTNVMKKHLRILPFLICAIGWIPQATAQPPAGRPADDPGKGQPKDYSNSSIVTRMMAFDKNGDGKLTKDEVTDPRLHRLFDRADANKDGVVTREELMALAAQLEAEVAEGRGPGGPRGQGPRGPGGQGPGGPGGPGAPSDGPPGGRGRGGIGGPPQPGQILPPFLQDRLNLTPQQRKQVEELQKEVDGKLAKILTDEQKKQLKEMREGFGGPGGRGPGGRGGPPGAPPDRRGPDGEARPE